MADGLNQSRALRLAQVIQEFRNLQHQIAMIRIAPTQTEADGEGYRVLRECAREAEAILRAPFSATSEPPHGDSKKEREQLQQVMLDASSRRFQAQRVYLRATAGMRWVNSRNGILQDGVETEAMQPALRGVTTTLQYELASITNDRVLADLMASDQRQGRWIAQDPSLSQILAFIASR